MSYRTSKNEYFMQIAKLVADRSTCVRRKVGAVLVKDGYILSTGYNGSPSGLRHCTKETCVRTRLNIPSAESPQLCRAVHAELNCIIQAARHGTSIEGNTTMYVTIFPCIECAKAVINAGIHDVVFLGDYDESNEVRREIIEECDTIFTKFAVQLEHGENSRYDTIKKVS